MPGTTVATNGTLRTMAQVTVPTGSAAQLTTSVLDSNVKARQGVILQSLSTNTASIWVGDSNTAVNRGLEITPGNSVTVPIDDPSHIYSISGTSSQKLNVVWS